MLLNTKQSFAIRSLVISFVVIFICESFFLVDILADMFQIDIAAPWISHDEIELASTITLSLALIAIGIQIKQLLREHRTVQDSVKVASGELLSVIEARFDDWQLSPSEKDIALLLIKGFSAQEIANLRNTRAGTVKSQSSAIYQKASVRGRNELVAFFMEDLLSGEKLSA
jgi:DNA-binding CsgD family transcriptional regulator